MNAIDKQKKAGQEGLVGLLVAHDIRPTRQRLSLAALLFDGNHKHVTAEQLLDMARKRSMPVSQATIYNTLHQFTKAGLMREIPVNQGLRYFDTNRDVHYHFFDEITGNICDIPADAIQTDALPKPPRGRVIDRIDVTIRLRKPSEEPSK